MWLVVDRIEGNTAVVEFNGQFYNIPRGTLREGQVYRWTGKRWRRDKQAEEQRRRAAETYLREMRSQDRGGDIRL